MERLFIDIACFFVVVFIFSFVLFKIVRFYARDDVGENVAPFLGCFASQFVVCAIVAIASALSAPDVVQESLFLIANAIAAWFTVKYFVSTTFQTAVAITATWFVFAAILVAVCNSPLVYVT